MRVIGIDIGSSSIKGAVLDLDRRAVGQVAQMPFCEPMPSLPPLHFEVDAGAVVERVRGVVGRLAAAAPDCRDVFFSTQMGGLILADEAGAARSAYLSWRDQRTTAEAGAGKGQTHRDRIRARLGEGLIGRMGNEFGPGGTINLLAWLADGGQLPAGPVTAMGLGDYVVLQLCGGNVPPATHPTAALGTLDLPTRQWCDAALDALGVRGVRWPRLVELDQPVGTCEVGGRRLRCFPAVGDHQCALAGARLAGGELSVNVSTGSQVSTRTSTLTLGPAYQTRPYFNGGWLNTITHLPAGRSLNALVDLLTELTPATAGVEAARAAAWEGIRRAIEATPPLAPATDLAVRLSFFAGPAGDRGSIGNITLENLTVGHLFRAAAANMADNYRDAALALGGSGWNRVVLSGGLAQKLAPLPGLVSERLGLPYRIASATEETLQGLMELATTIVDPPS